MSKSPKDSGQVLILAIAILVILLIGVLFLFDLSNVVRGKVKVNTAEQAAALTGANWQRETLNLIGEINLL
ncbi:MAG: Tad domain-containing protein, partial [Victivallaceae bacterium]